MKHSQESRKSINRKAAAAAMAALTLAACAPKEAHETPVRRAETISAAPQRGAMPSRGAMEEPQRGAMPSRGAMEESKRGAFDGSETLSTYEVTMNGMQSVAAYIFGAYMTTGQNNSEGLKYPVTNGEYIGVTKYVKNGDGYDRYDLGFTFKLKGKGAVDYVASENPKIYSVSVSKSKVDSLNVGGRLGGDIYTLSLEEDGNFSAYVQQDGQIPQNYTTRPLRGAEGPQHLTQDVARSINENMSAKVIEMYNAQGVKIQQ